MAKITFEEAYKLLTTPVPKFARRKGVGIKTVIELAEHYRKLVLGKEEVIRELYETR